MEKALAELETLRRTKRFEALLLCTTKMMRAAGRDVAPFAESSSENSMHRTLSLKGVMLTHQFWTYRGFAYMALLRKKGFAPQPAISCFRRALSCCPPPEKRIALLAAIEALQLLERIHANREARTRFDASEQGVAIATAPEADDTCARMRCMFLEAFAAEPEKKYNEETFCSDGVVRFLDVKDQMPLGNSREPLDRCQYVFFCGEGGGEPGWLHRGDGRSFVFDRIFMSGHDNYAPYLSGERLLPPGVYLAGASRNQIVNGRVWLKTYSHSFTAHERDARRLTQSFSDRMRGTRYNDVPAVLHKEFPRWDVLLSALAEGALAASVHQPCCDLDVFYSEPGLVPDTVRCCIQAELDGLGKRKACQRGDYPVPKYHNILDPNRFAMPERVLGYIDGNDPIYAVDYPSLEADIRAARAAAGSGADAQDNVDVVEKNVLRHHLQTHAGRFPMRWTCAEVCVKEQKKPRFVYLILLLQWVRALRGRSAKLPMGVAQKIMQYSGYADASAKVEWTSALWDLDPLRYHKLYFALARVLEQAMPMVAKLTRPALLLKDQVPAHSRDGVTLQVVVKAQRIFLEAGEDYFGMWHQDGLHEHIVAVVIYYYRHSLLGGNLEFCSTEQEMWYSMGEIPDRDPARCQVPVEPGTVVVFSNYQTAHRVLRMQTAEGSHQGGSREYVVFFLVDQTRPLRVCDAFSVGMHGGDDDDHYEEGARAHSSTEEGPTMKPSKEIRTDLERMQLLEEQLKPRYGFGASTFMGLSTSGNGDPRDLGWVRGELTGQAGQDAVECVFKWSECGPVARLQGLNLPAPLGRGASWAINMNMARLRDDEPPVVWDLDSPWVAVAMDVETSDTIDGDAASTLRRVFRITHFRNTVTGEISDELDGNGVSDVDFFNCLGTASCGLSGREQQ